MNRFSRLSIRLLCIVCATACTQCGGGTERGPSDAYGDTILDTAPDTAIDGGYDTETGPPDLVNLVKYVNTFIGTDDSDSPFPVPGGSGGSTYPGAVVPFGMVQFSPDTPNGSPSGYRFSDTEIDQFSLTHFDGAGCPNNEDIPILPVVGELVAPPGGDWAAYRSTCDKGSEKASPGYYSVELEKHGIRTELTATTRTGQARFTFPATDSARILINAGRSAMGLNEGSIEIIPPDRIKGSVDSGHFCWSPTSFRIYFSIVFSRPFDGFGTWLGGKTTFGSKAESGIAAGGFATFDTNTDPVVQMKIGLSYVSVANAVENLETENPDWDFDAIREAAETRWNEVLNRVRVTGGSADDLVKFYTALYHVFVNPNVASDVSGEYMGFDGVVHEADYTTYQNFSGWDIIRSWTHLVAALAPEGPDIIRSMVQDGIEGGLLPFWTHQNVETHVMVGDPGTVNVANAYAMGVRGFDSKAALELMKKSADDPTDTQRVDLDDWLNLHYVGNAAISLEYAMADFALAQFASALGDDEAHDKYLARSGYWRELWNPEDGYLEPRIASPKQGWDAARIYEFQVFGPDVPDTNLALGGSATASGSCNPDETASKAINGSWTGGPSDKWCDSYSTKKWLRIDLGAIVKVDRIVVHHAGSGGEPSAWNTQDFTVKASADSTTWTTVVEVSGNKEDTSTHEFGTIEARFIQLDIIEGIQGVETGKWDCQPFDPASDCGFVEGNGAQYLWMVPHDMEGLFDLLGGHAAAAERLDDLFTELNAGTNRPYFYIGNEPEHGTPWAYSFAGYPSRTQEVVRRIVDEEFNTGPGGLPGNDDLGATSAWLVWAYLGFYPAIVGTDVLVLHGPAFPSATLRLANGNVLRINGHGAGPATPYILGLNIDGSPTTRNWLRFSDISDGATLDYSMSASPGVNWGEDPADLPPSY